MKSLSRDAKHFVEWLDAIVAASDAHPEGLFHKEFVDWHVAQHSEHDDEALDPSNVEQMDRFNEDMRIAMGVFIDAKLITTTSERPYRVYPKMLRFTPQHELKLEATPKGRKLGAQSAAKKQRFFYLLIIKHQAVRIVSKIKVPLAVISVVFSTLKVILQWNTITAGVVAAVTAALAAIAVALGSR